MMIVTNKASSVFAAIEKMGATASTIEREGLVRLAGNSSPMFMRIVKAAYDPYTTYGMTKVPKRNPAMAPGTNTLDEDWPWGILERMSSRKLTGGEAQNEVQRVINLLDNASGALFTRIIRRDLRGNFTEGTINRVFPKTFADFPYMRCSLFDKSNLVKVDWAAGVISQEKADGMFANVNVDNVRQVLVTSRQGSPIPLDHLPDFEAQLAISFDSDTQTHGELTVYKDGACLAREIGNGMLNSIIQGGSMDEGCEVRFDAWDQIPLSAVQPKGKYETPYKERLAGIMRSLALAKPTLVRLIPTRIVKSKAQAFDHYRELLKAGKEGTVCKTMTAIWKDGTSKDQAKLKLEVDVDLEITEVALGTPGTKNEGRPGSVLCVSACSKLAVNVTVKNEKMREAIEKNPDDFIGKIIAVRGNSLMLPSASSDQHSMFLPRFIEDVVRTDKAFADDLKRIQDIFRNAAEAV